jgi:hypothetical protein
MSGTLVLDTTAQVNDRTEEWLPRASTKPCFIYGYRRAGLNRRSGTCVLYLGGNSYKGGLDQGEDRPTESLCGYVFGPDDHEFRLCFPVLRLADGREVTGRDARPGTHWHTDDDEPGSGRELDPRIGLLA